MASFKDAKDRSWTIRLDAPLIRRVNELFGVKLTDLRADPMFELSLDPEKLVNVLYVLCEKQATEKHVSDVDFGEGLGEQIDAAVAALEEAITDFFPASRRSLMQSLREKTRTMQQNAMDTAMEEIGSEEVKAAMRRKVKAQLLRIVESTDSPSSEESDSAT